MVFYTLESIVSTDVWSVVGLLKSTFELKGRFYAFDSTTIDLCMTLFPWAKFRRHKGGIKLHTQLDITTSIPVFYHLTNAIVHDVNTMDLISYEPTLPTCLIEVIGT